MNRISKERYIGYFETIDADVEVEVNESAFGSLEDEDDEDARSAEDALAAASLHSCPVCLGRGLCQVILDP